MVAVPVKRQSDIGQSVLMVSKKRTPLEIAALVWEITKANVGWGRARIANQLALLNIFNAASTLRSILNRPRPLRNTSTKIVPTAKKEPSPQIPARYPNYVLGADTTDRQTSRELRGGSLREASGLVEAPSALFS